MQSFSAVKRLSFYIVLVAYNFDKYKERIFILSKTGYFMKSFGYLRLIIKFFFSLCCLQRFDGAEGNLQHLLENNSRSLEEMRRSKEIPVPLNHLILSFIQIAYCLFNEKPFPSFSQVCLFYLNG
jgi:hypothetical protein